MAVDAGEYGVDLMRMSSLLHPHSHWHLTNNGSANRFIIDTLNESVIDLPDEGRELLNRYLCPSSPTKQKWKFWKKE